MPPLTVEFMKTLVAELDGENVTGIGITGSHARGTPTPFSDVNVLRFVQDAPAPEEAYRLFQRQDHLISLKTTTIAAKRAELTRPEDLIWAVPGIRQMRVLLDKRGELARLKRDVDPFNWRLFQPAADAYASRELLGFAEEAHKVMSGLFLNDEPAMLYATYGLVLGLARIMAVQRGLFIESENRYFEQVANLFEPGADWPRCFRSAAGLDNSLNGQPLTVTMRAFFALNLYLLTARELHAIILPEHQGVIRATAEAIEAQPYFLRGIQISMMPEHYLPEGEV
jgi:predicted nucleotidyltransferase